MAPSWLSSRQTGWERAADSPNMARRATVGGLVILIVGILIGVGIASIGSGGEKPLAINDSVVANPVLNDMKTAPKTADGAARAVTSYITGFPSVALLASDDQRKTISGIVSPNADPTLERDLVTLATQARNRLFGSGITDQVTARLVVAPASYKADMLSDDRARVQIWYMSVYVDTNGQLAQSNWTTVDVQVVWTDHWRLATYAAKGGPTPALFSGGSDTSSFSEVISVFNGFKAFRYATAIPAEK